MKKKFLILMLVLIALVSGITGISVSADGGEYNPSLASVAEMGSNGAESVYKGVTYKVGGANKDFYRGTDAEGNLFFQQVKTESYYWAVSDRKVYIDGFNASFKIEQLYKDQAIETGANWTIGLRYGDNANSDAHEMLGVTLVYNAEQENFAFYMNTREWTFWPKGHYNASSFADGTALNDETIELGNFAAGENSFSRPGLNEEINIQFRKLTNAEASAYGAVHFGNKSEIYYWFINGRLIDLPCVQNFTSDPGTTGYTPVWMWNGTAVHYGGDADNGYYGYFQLLDNQFNKEIVNIGSDFVTQATGATGRCARVTFFDVSGSGLNSGAPVVSDGSAYRTSQAKVGAYRGAEVYSAKNAGTGYGIVSQNVSLLSAAEAVIGLEFNNGRTATSNAQVYYLSSQEGLSDDYFGFDLRYAGDTGVYVDLNVNGRVYQTSLSASALTYNFGQDELAVSAFLGENDYFIVGAELLTLSAEAQTSLTEIKSSFANNGGYLYLGSSDGSATVAKIKTVDDGTATRKGIFLSLETTLNALKAERHTDLSDIEALFPSTVDFTVESATGEKETKTVNVVWTHGIDPDVPNNYTVKGAIADLETLKQSYYIGSALTNALSFTLQIAYDEDYVLFTGADYAALKTRWEVAGGGSNDFYYRSDGTGYEYFISDLYTDGFGRFMPGYNTKLDVNGFAWELKLNALGSGGMFGLFFNSSTGPTSHPVQAETSGRHFGIWINRPAENPDQAYVNMQQGYYLGGALQEGSINETARLYDAETESWIMFFDYKWDGSQSLLIETEIENGELNVYLRVNNKKYLLTADNETESIFKWDRISDSFAEDKMYPMIWAEGGKIEAAQKLTYTKYITEYTKPVDKVVDFYAEHGLPEQLTVLLNTGETMQVSVTYTGDYNKELAGDYELTGTLSAEEIGSDSAITQDCEATFKVRVTVKNETLIIKSFEKQADQTVELGAEPVFQTKFTVTVYSEARNVTEQKEIAFQWSSDNFNRLVAGTYTFTAQPEGNYVFDGAIADHATATVVVAEKEASGSAGCGSSAVSSQFVFCAIAVMTAAVILTLKKRNKEK